MSSYHYCDECGAGMPEPSLAEAFAKEQGCVHCGTDKSLTQSTCEFAVQSFQERFDRMEKYLSQWMPKE